MTGVGIAVIELATLVEELTDQFLGNGHCTDGKITRGEAFGHNHDIGPETHGFEAPPVAGAAEAADDLIGDHQDPYFRQMRSTSGQ